MLSSSTDFCLAESSITSKTTSHLSNCLFLSSILYRHSRNEFSASGHCLSLYTSFLKLYSRLSNTGFIHTFYTLSPGLVKQPILGCFFPIKKQIQNCLSSSKITPLGKNVTKSSLIIALVTFQNMSNYYFSLYSDLLKNKSFSPPTQLIAKERYVKGGKLMENGRSRQP